MLITALGAVLLAGGAMAASDSAATVGDTLSEKRVSRTQHFRKDGRSAARLASSGTESIDEYSALESDGNRTTISSKTAGMEGTTTSQSFGYDFWVYTADVILFYDEDNDGHFTGIDLNFDIDTIYNSADVYAAVYLSYEGGPWNEYAISEDFTIYDTSGGDDYTLVTDLVTGYPTGEYDLLIEVFDAYTGDFVASFGPEDTSELSYLPLEDIDSDTPAVVERRVTITREGGGGAAGLWMLLALAGVFVARVRTGR